MPEKKTLGHIVVMVVDDEDFVRQLLGKAIKKEGFQCLTAATGNEALSVLEQKKIDVVITDINMPELNGIDLMIRIKRKYESDVIVITGYETEAYTYDQIIEKGASDFVQKSQDYKELMMRLKRVIKERRLISERDQANQNLKKSLSILQRVLEGTINAFASAVEMKDPYITGHQERVSKLSFAIAHHLHLSTDQANGVRIAGLLHDIGMLTVPSEVLNKPAQLTETEFNYIKNHPKTGYEILKKIEFPWPVKDAVLQHHERIDGSGYPNGLLEKDLHIGAKIIAVADVVETMSSSTPLRPAMDIDQALNEISVKKGLLYDTAVVDICLRLFREDHFTFE